MKLLIFLFVSTLIVGLFFNSKLTPYKASLTGNYLKAYLFFDGIFNPLLSVLRKLTKPTQVGNGIAVDTSQIILLILFLIILKIFL